MSVNSIVFETYLQCPTKGYLRSLGETGTGNAYAEWVREQNEAYRNEGMKRLTEDVPPGECVLGPLAIEDLKRAKWRLATNVTVQAKYLESTLVTVERRPIQRARGWSVGR